MGPIIAELLSCKALAARPIQRLVEAFEKGFITEGLAQKCYSAAIKRLLQGALRKESSDKNNRRPFPTFDQAFLQIKARQPGHLQVSNQTRRVVSQARFKKRFSG